MKYIIKHVGATIPLGIGITALILIPGAKIGSISYCVALLLSLFVTIPAYAYWVEKIDNHLK